MAETTVAQVMAELAALEDPKARAVNEKHGDDHGVNLGELRALAKRLKTQQELARRLWETDDTAARLLAILICRPKAFERSELDVMVREARTPKVHDWLVNYVVKKNPHSEELRMAWSADPDPVVASAGWALTTERVAKKPEGLDLAELLNVIEAEMKDAPDGLQADYGVALVSTVHYYSRDPEAVQRAGQASNSRNEFGRCVDHSCEQAD